jgi:hypothetical protein
MPPYKTRKPYVCSICKLEVELADYFSLKIRNEESKIGHQFNACRDCLMDGLYDLPFSQAEEDKFQYEREKK